MKKEKIIIVGLLSLVLLCTTGCLNSKKEKKLICAITSSGVDITLNVGFEGNMVKTMDFKYDMNLSSYSDAQISAVEKQDFCSIVKKTMSGYENAFTDCNQKVEDKHLLVNSELDVDKVATNVLDKMGSPEKTKEELEKSGYTCEIQ